MNILALDTSTGRAAIGLETRSGRLLAETTDAAQTHGRDLIPRLAAMLAEAGLAASDIEVIGVGLGPGSFTGLRVGVTAAKTLAYVTGAALIGLDSLEGVAWNAPKEALRVSVVGDAQRGDVYSADFARNSEGEPLACTRATQIEPLESWLGRLETGTVVLGPGLALPRIGRFVPPELMPTASEFNEHDGRRLVELTHREWTAGRRENPWLLEPTYLRRSAAEEVWSSGKRPGPD
jgi:tRNA threonylcarbamoyladenosine biosynthesis protein TsaB